MSTSTTTTTRPMPSTASTTATAAASGQDVKGKAPSLQTPLSASYPSELRSPLPGTSSFFKKEEQIKTPITPPSAYLDFLKDFPRPALMSPPTTSGSVSKFPAGDRVTTLSPDNTETAGQTPQPVLSRQTSSESSTSSFSSASSISSNMSNEASISDSAFSTIKADAKSKPQSPRIIIPPSPFAKPSSARTPRLLNIPQSPFSAASVRSPMSTRSLQSPYSASAMSATPWSATFSPRGTANPRTSTNTEADTETKSKSGKVCVRQVVTRTVTYCRTPLDPAPKGKRRKVDDQDSGTEKKEKKDDAADT